MNEFGLKRRIYVLATIVGLASVCVWAARPIGTRRRLSELDSLVAKYRMLGLPMAHRAASPGKAASLMLGPFGVDFELAQAVQERMAGNDARALALIDQVSTRPAEPVPMFAVLPPHPTLDERMYELGVQYWINRLFKPGSDRTEILSRLRQIVSVCPEIEGTNLTDVIERLRFTLQSLKKPKSSDERAIDGLCDVLIPLDTAEWRDDVAQTKEMKSILALELKRVVPLLMSHLRDPRLTRAACWETIGLPTAHIGSVGELCLGILQVLSGFVPDMAYCELSFKQMESWWAKASSIDERDLLKARLEQPQLKVNELCPPDLAREMALLRHPDLVAEP